MDCSVSKTPQALLQKDDNIFPHASSVTRERRNYRFQHQSGVVWLTGLSGAGKSTIATGVEKALFDEGYLVSILDGDTVRAGLNSDLDFTREGRHENLRRVAEVSSLFATSGHIVIATLISPNEADRQYVKSIVNQNFHTVHIYANIDDCIKRDPKGLYAKAMSGGIENFTGISQGYEVPPTPNLLINTSEHSIEESQQILKNYIIENFSLENLSDKRA